jgi:hypothetical protein
MHLKMVADSLVDAIMWKSTAGNQSATQHYEG